MARKTVAPREFNTGAQIACTKLFTAIVHGLHTKVVRECIRAIANERVIHILRFLDSCVQNLDDDDDQRGLVWVW